MQFGTFVSGMWHCLVGCYAVNFKNLIKNLPLLDSVLSEGKKKKTIDFCSHGCLMGHHCGQSQLYSITHSSYLCSCTQDLNAHIGSKGMREITF